MDNPSQRGFVGSSYVDHPTPSIWVLGINVFTNAALVCAIVLGIQSSSHIAWFPLTVLGGLLLIGAFFFWPLYSTYYTLSATGIVVRYGPWIRAYPYSDFASAHWQKGMFGIRIGWFTVTPSVRMTNAVVLERRSWWKFGLYLTPKDPEAFMERLSLFAPELTRERNGGAH